jgi:hemerythrin superfamily protein
MATYRIVPTIIREESSATPTTTAAVATSGTATAPNLGVTGATPSAPVILEAPIKELEVEMKPAEIKAPFESTMVEMRPAVTETTRPVEFISRPLEFTTARPVEALPAEHRVEGKSTILETKPFKTTQRLESTEHHRHHHYEMATDLIEEEHHPHKKRTIELTPVDTRTIPLEITRAPPPPPPRVETSRVLETPHLGTPVPQLGVPAGVEGPEDLLTLLTRDHRDIDHLFVSWETGVGDRDILKKEIIKRLVSHDFVEREILYPTTRKFAPQFADECLHEHGDITKILDTLNMNSYRKQPGLVMERMNCLIREVRTHVLQEENQLFPYLRAHVTADFWIKEADQARKLKMVGPSRPHPRITPNRPPFSTIAGIAVGMVDKAMEKMSLAH